MASNPPNPPPGAGKRTKTPPPTTDDSFTIALTPRNVAMQRLRDLQDPETAAINEHYRRTGQLPRVLGQSPLAGSLAAPTSGIAGTRFTPVNRPAANAGGTTFTPVNPAGAGTTGAGTRPGDTNIPGVTINRATNGSVAPGANPRARGPRGRLPAPTPMGLPPGVIVRQPGVEPRRNMQRYGAFIEDSPEPPPALRPDVPPPSDAELRARLAMQTGQKGVIKYPIRYMGILPDELSEDFDASTGYNPPPPGQRGTDAEERAWEKVRVESLRGVRFGEWNTSWLMRMAQLKGVGVELEGGEAEVREVLERELTEVKMAEKAVAVQEALVGTDGGRWAKVVEAEVEQERYILVDEDKDDMEVIKSKVATTWQQQAKMDLPASDVSLWLSAVTWGTKPSRMVRWAGRNAEMDDGHWLGIYVYRLTRKGKAAEVERNEQYEREARRSAAGR
ncbi:hypothetical protein VE01_07487 [Pseudogymnoascus verrucosus]|uniref:Uncharacterized protein n=1 Tax=Pseudogymnoascus verrucosus TaxID=342668 RepID=A0A1B8GGG0_9PEZI|nr:uncharacterized protein VE01_07487 [Pseudogymnoascus verrucosus]OBT94910.1 hypothetical protein VE01_07487 [Pseudogymnoascus verrucosus]